MDGRVSPAQACVLMELNTRVSITLVLPKLMGRATRPSVAHRLALGLVIRMILVQMDIVYDKMRNGTSINAPPPLAGVRPNPNPACL